MPQVRMKKDNEEELVKHYVVLRNLELSGQHDSAIEYFQANQLINNWRSLLHYAGVKKNCPVCCLIIDQVYFHRADIFTDEQFPTEISKAVHGIHLDFSKRIMVYLKSGKFDSKLEEYIKMNEGIAETMNSIGHDFVNLKPHHFQNP